MAVCLATGAGKLPIAAGAVFAVGIFVCVLFSPYLGLLLSVGFLPFHPFASFYLPSLGSVWMGAAIRDGLAGAVLLGWLIHRRFKADRRLTGSEKFALVYVFLLALYIPASPVLEGALAAFRNLAGYIILMTVAADTINTPKRLRAVLLVAIIAASVSAAIGIAEVFTDRQIFDVIGYDFFSFLGADIPVTLLGTARATGGTGNPLEFGLHLSWVAILCIALVWGKMTPIRPRYLLLLLLILLAAIAVTFARSAYLAFAVGFLTMAVLLEKRRAVIPLGAAVLVWLLLASTPVGDLLFSRVTLRDTPGQQTIEGRREVLEQVFSMRLRWWGGDGLGTQGASLARSGLDPYIRVTDGYYVILLLQVGFLPVLAFLIVTGSLARKFIHLARSKSDPAVRALGAAGAALVVMVLANSVASSAFESRSLNIVFWVLMGSFLAPSGWPRSFRQKGAISAVQPVRTGPTQLSRSEPVPVAHSQPRPCGEQRREPAPQDATIAPHRAVSS